MLSSPCHPKRSHLSLSLLTTTFQIILVQSILLSLLLSCQSPISILDSFNFALPRLVPLHLSTPLRSQISIASNPHPGPKPPPPDLHTTLGWFALLRRDRRAVSVSTYTPSSLSTPFKRSHLFFLSRPLSSYPTHTIHPHQTSSFGIPFPDLSSIFKSSSLQQHYSFIHPPPRLVRHSSSHVPDPRLVYTHDTHNHTTFVILIFATQLAQAQQAQNRLGCTRRPLLRSSPPRSPTTLAPYKETPPNGHLEIGIVIGLSLASTTLPHLAVCS